MDRTFDVLILGGGSAAEGLATSLSRAGRSVAVVEERLFGGECPFFACMPSKAMLHSAALRQRLTRVRELGAMGDPLTLVRPDKGYARAVARRDEVAGHRDDEQHRSGLHEAGVSTFRGTATVVAPDAAEVEGEDGTTRLGWRDLVIATGTAPSMPPLEGLDDVEVWTSEEAWSTSELPDSLVVLGGGAVGCEIAQTFRRFGAAVTVVDTQSNLAPSFDPEVVGWLEDAFREEGIELRLGAQAESVHRSGDGVRLEFADSPPVDAERLVVATGFTPRLEGLGLHHLGIDVDPGLQLDEHCRVVGTEHVWAAGDVTGIAPFTHVANYQARVIAANLTGGDRRASYAAIPRAIYTDPTVAGVGMTAAEAEDAGVDVASSTFDLADTAIVAADGEPGGRLCLHADRADHVIIGATAVGPHAMDWLGEVAVAIRARTPLDVLADVVHAFPTYGEALGSCYRELAGEA